MSDRKLERVSRSRPCPICGRPDWCVHVDGGTICARNESTVRAGGAGWFHASGEPRIEPFRPGRQVRQLAEEVVEVADRHFLAHNAPQARIALARRLGVTVASLERLRVGWNGSIQAWTFPMRDGRGRVVGVQNRFHESGEKRVMKGHASGVFEPFQLDVRDRDLVVCEGASDTAAALSIGLEAIGRFSCSGTLTEIVERIRRHRPARVTIVADNDDCGLRGARDLVGKLDGIALAQIRTPPPGIKDMRSWTHAGALAGDITEGAT